MRDHQFHPNQFRLGKVLFVVTNVENPYGKILDLATGKKIHIRLSDGRCPEIIAGELYYGVEGRYGAFRNPKPEEHVVFEIFEEDLGPAAYPWMYLTDVAVAIHLLELDREPHCDDCDHLQRFHDHDGNCPLLDCDCGKSSLDLIIQQEWEDIARDNTNSDRQDEVSFWEGNQTEGEPEIQLDEFLAEALKPYKKDITTLARKLLERRGIEIPTSDEEVRMLAYEDQKEEDFIAAHVFRLNKERVEFTRADWEEILKLSGPEKMKDNMAFMACLSYGISI
jgi:hypothetical protein